MEVVEKVLVLAHTDSEGTLSKHALEVLAAATELGFDFSVGLIGKNTKTAAELISGCAAKQIFAVTGVEFGESRYATDVAAAEAICRKTDSTMVLVPATSRFNRMIAGLAHRLGGKANTHVTGLVKESDSMQISRWYYRQRMEAEYSRSKRPWCLAIESGCFSPWSSGSGSSSAAGVEELELPTSDELLQTVVAGMKVPEAELQTIRPEAEVLFVAGAGWTKKQADGLIHAEDASKLILGFLEESQASLGGSKSVVDLNSEGQAVLPFMTHLNQIGQTGATPRHKKGLSTCCHGEEPHVVGWRFITERRAINTDPNCSWAHGKCDVLYVADAFKVMEHLNQLLKKRKLQAVQ